MSLLIKLCTIHFKPGNPPKIEKLKSATERLLFLRADPKPDYILMSPQYKKQYSESRIE